MRSATDAQLGAWLEHTREHLAAGREKLLRGSHGTP
jgi:hypothetical protein